MLVQNSDIKRYSFSDLVDIDAFASMMKHFYHATGIANSLVGAKGELLTQAGWANACVQFHRANCETAELCLQSNLKLMADVEDGKVTSQLCANGLLDYATPVEIEGCKIATLFLGQVLHEAPDLTFFKARARQFGFDEDEYIDAIRQIPVVEKAEVDSLMTCMVDMARMLALCGLARLRQKTMEKEISRHKERQIQLEDILNSTPVATGWANTATGRIEYVNRAFQQLFGYTLEDLPDFKSWYRLAYRQRRRRDSEIRPWLRTIDKDRKAGEPQPEVETTVTCKDGSNKRVQLRATRVGPRLLISFSDITDRWQAERRLHARDKMLEMVATDSKMQDILNKLVEQVQLEDTSSICSILLMDHEGKRLLTGAAPNLPEFYNRAIDGVEIGLNVGSCGTAAYLKQRVVVEDITTHRYWQDYRQLAAEAGVRSCWSEPIFSSKGKVIGTFAIYHRDAAKPSDKDLELIGFAANIASIAIENRLSQQDLEKRAYYDHLTGLANRRYFLERAQSELKRAVRYKRPVSVLMMDVDHFKLVNDTYGHKVGDVVLKMLAQTSIRVLRNIDLMGRIGGEEFAVVLPEVDQAQALEIAQRLNAQLATLKIEAGDEKPVCFTVSIGVVTQRGDDIGIDTMLDKADQALYRAKKSGRNRVCVYSQGS